MMRTFIAFAVTSLAVACSGGQTASLTVNSAEYRAPLVDGGSGVAYFSITSTIADRITGVSSPSAKAVEIHESTFAGGMARMERRDVVELPAGKTVTFGPGGLHLMVIEPQRISAPATFSIQLTLESGHVETISFAGAPAS
jgi:copper(I)-binding protein